MKKKKKSGKSEVLVRKSKAWTGKDTKLLDQQHMELQKSSPNSFKEEAAAGSFEEQYFAIWAYKFREQELVDAWPELQSAAEKHGLYLRLSRVRLTKMKSTRARRMMKKKSEKSKGLVGKSTRSRDEGTYGLNPLHTELQKSSPNSLNREQYFATCFYRFREQVLVDAWPELESATKKHGLYLTLHRDDKFYIAIRTTPWTRDPGIFDTAKEFLEVLASTNVPPSVAIQILNGDVHHEYIMVGHEEGGLCLKHGITMEQFAKRWKRFRHILQGNTITAVGDSLPHVKLIRNYVEACIVHNMKPASVLERVKVRYDRCVVEMQLEALSI